MTKTANIFKNKKHVVLLTMLLALVVASGLTMAYLFTKTDPVTNEFTFAENIKAELEEPGWDPENATNLVPGMDIPKDPQITNTSENEISEWVGIRLVFTNGEGTPLSNTATDKNYVGTLLDLITIDWNTTDWQLADTAMAGKVEQVWAYKYELAPGDTTSPLFTQVTIKDSVTPEQQEWLRDYLKGFNIVLEGGAVQYEAFDTLNDAVVALLELLLV
ncbi:MAG: hypothetical protein FWG23_08205 [Eggerthellaceae bacterium]|jgi:hypothetical protein|nr:hypothetical protein [Eggerthellaceae bacterium]MDR2715351.1 hypothetical protein [Coriobacteriaceae bacterium]